MCDTIKKRQMDWRTDSMKYVVIGAGGTGGAIGGFMAKAGKEVTLIARGQHLAVIKKKGLTFEAVEETYTVPVRACTMEEYICGLDEESKNGGPVDSQGRPNVIFVCVKGYSLADTVPFIRRIAHKDTVVIPILNIYGTGGRLQQELPELTVTDGCIYIAAEIKCPGTILLSGKIFRVVYGLRRGTAQEIRDHVMPVLRQVEKDLADAGILPTFSPQIERDALQKFSFVSPMAAQGACYDIHAVACQSEGEMRDIFVELVKEVKALSDAMGIGLPDNIVEINLKIMDDLAPGASASMHRDIKAGKQSEVDGLVYEVVRLGQKYGVAVPTYEKIAVELHRRFD